MALFVSIMSTIAAFIAAYAANRSNRVAQSLGELERQRRHSELTPKFKFRVEGIGLSSKRIWVQLVGPSGLVQLDKLTLTIRDNVRDIQPSATGRPNAEDVANQVWGPYRFQQDVSGVSDNGRTAQVATPLLLGDDCAFIVEETPTPVGYQGASEAWEYRFLPNRITFLCEREKQVWTVPVESPDYAN